MPAGPTIIARFLADTRDLTNSVDRASQSAGDRLKSFAKDAALAIGGAFAVSKVVDFAKDSINAASDLAESTSKVGVVFKDAGQSVLDWSKDSATAMGLSQQAALEAAGTYGNLAVSLGLTPAKAAEMSTSLVELAGDLASFNNVPTADALQALQSGLTGETEPLKKFGINMNEATLKAEAMALGLSDGKGTLDASAKAQAAYSLMLKQTGTAQGDFARTSEGLANQQRISAAKFEDLQAKIGTQLLPAMTAIASFISGSLIPAISDLADWVGNSLMPALSDLGTWMSDNSVTVGLLAAAFVSFTLAVKAHAIATSLYSNAVKIASAVQAAWNAVMAANPIFLIVAAIALLVAGLVWAYNNVEWFRDAVNAAWEMIKAAATKVWEWIQAVFGFIAPALQLYVSVWLAIFTTAWDIIKAVVTTLWDWIQTVFGWIVTGVSAYVGFLVAVYSTAWNVILAVVTTLWDWIQTVFGWIVTGVTTYVNTWVAIFTGAWDLIKSGVTTVWQWIVDKFNAIKDTVSTVVNSITGFFSGAWDSVKNGATEVWRWVTDKFQAMVDFFAGIPDKFRNIAGQIVDAIKTPINALLRLWNDLAFEIPRIDIPEVDLGPLGKRGGGSIGGNRIDFPNLPLLAKGGVLTSPTLFVGGEAGTEIVAPEALLRTIVAEEGGGDTFVLNMYPRTADAADIAYGFRRLELLAGYS